MARIPGVPKKGAGIGVKLAYFFSRRGMAEMTGTETERMIEPIEVYAHAPHLLKGYGKMEQATAELKHLDKRSRALAELKTATIVQCEFCIDLGSLIARRWGLSDDELLALPSYSGSDLFDLRDKLVLDYAVAMSRTPTEVSDGLFDALREHFSDPELVELTHIVAIENHRARFNLAFDIGSTGFSDGAVCAVPVGAGEAGAAMSASGAA